MSAATDTLARVIDFFGLPDLAPLPLPIEIPHRVRGDLPRLFTALGAKEGAEIGVWRGDYSRVLCEGVPGLHLYAVDPWTAYAAYPDHRRHSKFEESYQAAQDALAGHNVTFLRQFSVEAAHSVPDGSLDFVYIDGNHRIECVIGDLAAWIPKVRAGGIIAGHDYDAFVAPKHACHVYWALNAWTAAYDVRPWFVLGRGRDVLRLRGDNPDRFRSFFWVTP